MVPPLTTELGGQQQQQQTAHTMSFLVPTSQVFVASGKEWRNEVFRLKLDGPEEPRCGGSQRSLFKCERVASFGGTETLPERSTGLIPLRRYRREDLFPRKQLAEFIEEVMSFSYSHQVLTSPTMGDVVSNFLYLMGTKEDRAWVR